MKNFQDTLLFNDHVFLKTWNGFKKISSTEIMYAKADFQGIKLVLQEGLECDCPFSLTCLSEKLNASHFFRVHRKYLVNIHYINEYSSKTETIRIQHQNVRIDLPIARRNKKAFLESWFKSEQVSL